MDSYEKNALESLKNIDFKQLFMKDTYVEIQINDDVKDAYIDDIKEKEKCLLYIHTVDGRNGRMEFPMNILNFYQQSDYAEEKVRNTVINFNIFEMGIDKIIYIINQKLESLGIHLKNQKNPKKDNNTNIVSSNKPQNIDKNKIIDKNGKSLDIQGYWIYQFLFGYILDCLGFAHIKLNNHNFKSPEKSLLILILDIIIYMIDVVKGNLKKYKTAYFNRRLLIVSKIHGILIGFDTIINNLVNLYGFNFSVDRELDKRFILIVQSIYDIILASKDSCSIPLTSLLIFFKLIIFADNSRQIKNYKAQDLYSCLNQHLKNLNENELKNIKKNSDMKKEIEYIINNLFPDKELNTFINQTYYCFLLSCLKCKNLEKRINALNDICEIINEFGGNKNLDKLFKNFIEDNKILEMFFEDSLHDEIVKRSINLFKYFAKFDALNDSIIEKLIERQTNDLMKNILIEIISELPMKKKVKLFKRLTKGLKLENENDFEFISSLNESCLSKSFNEEDESKNEKEGKKSKDYYGINMIFEYIIKKFDNKKKYDENNIDTSIDSFVRLISKIMTNGIFDIDDVFFFIDQLFNNIKNNNNNSVIQSIKLIQKLLDIIKNKKKIQDLINLLKKLDEKYEIITLLLNDLKRYINILPNNFSSIKCKDKIYEGIYPHNINIELRLELIFYFFKKSKNNYELKIKDKKHIEEIYKIFKPEKYKEEQKKFYEIFTKNVHEIDDTILEEFFNHIIKNKEEINLKTINDEETINLIIQTFKMVNENKQNILDDGRNIRVNGEVQIEGFDMLFDLLTQNSNKNVQNKISQILCDICICFKDYNDPTIPDYWKKYFKKITLYIDNINKSHDKIAFSGIIKLLNKIYSSSCNCYGIIPESNHKTNQSEFKIYHFKNIRTNRDYRLRAGINDRIIDMRWKLAYYYDLHVNNVTFIDLTGKKYSLNNDFEKFVDIFTNEKYFLDRGFAFIKVDDIPFQLLQMKDNPKVLIENNEKIYNILIDNLRVDIKNDNEKNVEIENKQKIWNLISQLPKNYFFENKLKKFGEKENIEENNLEEILDKKEIYLLAYSLLCFNNFLLDKKNEKNHQVIPDKKEFLNNFINIYHGDKLIYDKLLYINVDKNNCNPIQIECLTLIIDILYEIEKYKESQKGIKFENIFANKELYNTYFKTLTEIISNLLELNYAKYKDSINQMTEDDIKDNSANNNTGGEKQKIYKDIANLIEHIFNFIEKMSKDEVSYMDYLFNNIELFTKVFVYDYIKCETDESRKIIDDYLNKSCIKNSDYINKYFEVILTVNIFNYLVKNDKDGKYFHAISKIMSKYYENNKNNNTTKNPDSPNKESIIESKHIIQLKQIIDIILDYIKNECEKEDENYEKMNEKEMNILIENNENFKEGILLFLENIIKLDPNELVDYIRTKVDIYDLFFNKCILRKCVEKPLGEKKPFCLTNKSQSGVYELLFIILRNIKDNDLYLKIVDKMNKYHQLGFWKTFKVKNWDLEYKEMRKWKYVGLKNMTATCYLNAIIQQLFMIPIFRETILKIENNSKNNVLYELQLLFSALKIYEFAYYDPRSFVVINKLNFYEQMDADEFYGTLIDKVENDIKNIFSKIPSKTPGSAAPNTPNPNDSKNINYKYKDIFNYFFGIKVVDELKFVDCGHKRYNEFFYNSIQLEINQSNNIYESFNNYFKTEIMDGDNKINCEQCNKKRTCHKHLIFKTLPNILVIALKRFEFDYNTMLKYKLNKYFEFPYKLDMKDYLIENHSETNTEYELTGVTIHYGVADFGHYYDLIKGPDNKWYNFNDISVSEFEEENIPKEAFGEKEIIEEDSIKEKERGKNNAYILIYKKKNFENDIVKKNNPDIALPPYSKYSNINDAIKKVINLKIFESWTLKSIITSDYQKFVLHLLKMDLVKNIDNSIEKNHFQFIIKLKNEGYIIENNKKTNNNNKIFEFALRYYFNVMLRVSRNVEDKTIFDKFKEIIIIYIERDVDKARFILEEFSRSEAIDEFLVYCPNKRSVKDCLDIILNAFNVLYIENNNNDSFIFEFINSLIIYIDKNIRKIALEDVNNLFLQIISKGGMHYINYLKKKSYHKWVRSFFGNNNYKNINIINEGIYPTLKSQHSILTDKTCEDKNNKKKGLFEEGESDMQDQHFYHKLNNVEVNRNLIIEMNNYLEG
jgi:ubiquitin C-terminal hydrolase